EERLAEVATIDIGRQHRRGRALPRHPLQLLHGRLGRLAGNEADGAESPRVGGAVFEQPLVHGVTERGGQLAAHKPVDGERDLGAEEHGDVDALRVHVLQALKWIGHAGAVLAGLVGERPRHARPWALRGAPDPSLQENPRVALIVLEAHGPLRAPRLGQAAREIDVAFVHVAGGILGMKLETAVQDTQTDPPTSVAVMRRVLNDKPFAIFGTVYSSSTVANMDIAKQAGIPQFTGSESVIITQKGNDNIFLTSFGQDVGMAKFVRWLVDDVKAEKIAHELGRSE